ncbi:L,D-transpeptidase family protein [Aliihoeflea aestuarii]|jgi:lipoprotein-anchoring transpeptidase ErfK/SrfK|uniref:L,D-transpeptidase n=1 Tax=Aliihoeflea aestuarii TaxID=453840 RepID=UPI0020934143|nr:L,D-transpeptidase [Aliihoeflea aestuarii]MCO6391316.1 L,D-transpeptidase family protein [Aliihoeflea aestuarii]
MTDRSTSAGDALPMRLNRRFLLLGAGSLALAGCVSTPEPQPEPEPLPPVRPAMYDAMPEEPYDVPAVDVSQMAPEWWRREVDYETEERPGTLIVETGQKYLYHVRPNGRAMRYGIGVGRDGFSWQGRAVIAYRREWPRWTPPDSMVARQPELEPYSIANGGMDPSATNPMGARGLYIHQNGRDTIYRVHGTHQPWSIGRSISSGCIRLINQDIIHLHANVRDGSAIVVRHDTAPDLIAVAG